MALKFLSKFSLLFALNFFSSFESYKPVDERIPMVINTWAFTNATIEAWDSLNRQKKSAVSTSQKKSLLNSSKFFIFKVDAVVDGCSVCEREQCDGTVGYGGSPNELAETCLDALIFDGKTMNVGAVGSLRNIKEAIAVAKHVLLYTRHTLLVGEQATDFAVMMGFKKKSLTTSKSKKMWKDWKNSNCQPNFWINVLPDPLSNCGPYHPIAEDRLKTSSNEIDSLFSSKNHDTIGMVAIDVYGSIAAGTSTNGANHKIPGRVGDSPIPVSNSLSMRAVNNREFLIFRVLAHTLIMKLVELPLQVMATFS